MDSSKSNGLEPSNWARAPVDAGPTWQRALKLIYNPGENTFLGRTPKRWGIVVVFYTVFYIVLGIMFYCCMLGMNLTIDQKIPKYTLESSLIGSNPGMDYRPRATTKDIEVRYNRNNDSEFDNYIKELDEFVAPYVVHGRTNCTASDNYGFPDSPCFYIKLNKIYGWEPQFYEKGSLPDDMPGDLKDYINNQDDPNELRKIWISCAHEKNVTGVITYPWDRGLNGKLYPYLNQEGYKTPIIAVQILSPGSETIIRCRAWAKNIQYNKSLKEPRGYTRFVLKIDGQNA